MIGTRVAGRYRLVRALGAGGTAEVFAAVDEALNREVAVKLLRTRLAPGASLAGAAGEFHVLATLSHPGLVAVSDLGVHDDHPFVVSELLAGRTLRALLAEGVFPAPGWRGARTPPPRDPQLELTGSASTTIALLAALADIVAALHAAGVIHRDLKPENVMVSPGGAVRVMDFGLAHVVARGGVELEAGAGTAPYMAPELIERGAASEASDLYAFGCIAYELIAGTPPFTGGELATVVLGHLTAVPPPLSERAPQVPPQLHALIDTLLSKLPGDRPSGAAAVAHSLRAMEGAARSCDRVPLPPALAALRARHGGGDDLPLTVRAALDAAARSARDGRPVHVLLEGEDAADLLRGWRARGQSADLTILEVRVDPRDTESPLPAIRRRLDALRDLLGTPVSPATTSHDLAAGLARVAAMRPVLVCIEDIGVIQPQALRNCWRSVPRWPARR